MSAVSGLKSPLRWSRAPRAGWLLDLARIAALATLLCCGAMTPGFLSRVSLFSLASATSFVGCVALGMTFITLGGNIMSFSLGMTLSVTTIIFVTILPAGVWIAAILALVFSAALTALQGALIGFFRANPLIVSFAALSLMTGAATWITGGHGIYPEGNEASILVTPAGPVPMPLVAFLASTALAQVIAAKTSFGRRLMMTGSNPRAAEVAGVETWRTVTISYALAGFFTGVAAVLMSARYGSGDLELGMGYDYTAISAVLAGGTAIGGGKGSPLRTFFGAFGIATVQALLVLWGFSTQMQFLVTGLIVLAIIMLQTVGDTR